LTAAEWVDVCQMPVSEAPAAENPPA